MRVYTVFVNERVKEVLGKLEIPSTAELSYSFDNGYERFSYRESPEHGWRHFEGVYHPDGYCDGTGTCIYCGRTLAFDYE